VTREEFKNIKRCRSSLMDDPLDQACQTQTTLRAANATKTDKRAAKLLKKVLSGQIFTKYNE